MKGSAKVAKGRIEEAAGALVNNEKLRAKGQDDQAMGRIKQSAEAGVKKAKDSARKSVDKAKEVAERTMDKARNRA